MSALCPGCVKTRKGRECAELYSFFVSFDRGRQHCSFLFQCNRDKLSARGFDVGVFTQPVPIRNIRGRRTKTETAVLLIRIGPPREMNPSSCRTSPYPAYGRPDAHQIVLRQVSAPASFARQRAPLAFVPKERR